MRRRSAESVRPADEEVPTPYSPDEPDSRVRASWSKARLSAAVAAIRCSRASRSGERPLQDELEFFGAVGTRHEVRSGTVLSRRGSAVSEVHLVERGAVAVTGDHRGHSPILAFALRRELCCAVPALFTEATPWNAVAVMNSSVITVSADTFTAAVRDRWVDRWTTRTLTWLADVGTWATDLDQPDPRMRVATLLLRVRGAHSEDLCRRTISDVLDLDDVTTRNALSDLERIGALQHVGGRFSVARPDILRATLSSVGRPQRHRARAKVARRDAPRAVAAG